MERNKGEKAKSRDWVDLGGEGDERLLARFFWFFINELFIDEIEENLTTLRNRHETKITNPKPLTTD